MEKSEERRDAKNNGGKEEKDERDEEVATTKSKTVEIWGNFDNNNTSNISDTVDKNWDEREELRLPFLNAAGEEKDESNDREDGVQKVKEKHRLKEHIEIVFAVHSAHRGEEENDGKKSEGSGARGGEIEGGNFAG